MAERVVAVTGAAGFIGSHVVRMLRTEGFEVRAVVRPGTKKSQRLAAVQGLGCTVAYADVGDLGALERAFDGCAAVVHLVAIIRERVGATFDLVNRRGAAEVAAAAKVSGVQRIVHLSALGAGPEAPRYLQSKWMGEEAIRRSGVPSVIIRPSFVIGPGGGAAIQFAAVVRLGPWYPLYLLGVPARPLEVLAVLAPIVPVLGSGQYRSMPLDVRDLLAVVGQALRRDDVLGEVYELGGPHALTYDGLLDDVMAVLVREFRYLPNPPITQDEFEALLVDNVCDNTKAVRTFGLTLKPFRDAMRYALHHPRQFDESGR